MRHFFAYHNAEKRRFAGTSIREPRVRTSKNVLAAKGATVWLVSGEGRTPKSFFLVARFVAVDCMPNAHPHTELPHEVRGYGRTFGGSTPIRGRLLDDIKRDSACFHRGFYEIQNADIISALESIAR